MEVRGVLIQEVGGYKEKVLKTVKSEKSAVKCFDTKNHVIKCVKRKTENAV